MTAYWWPTSAAISANTCPTTPGCHARWPQGLVPTGWHKTVETYGAAQLQKRFEALTGRWMNDRDFAAWVAVRSIASAVTRLGATDAAAIRTLELSPDLPLDGFKGRKLSYRPWDGQLRQPIELIQPRALISTSPQDGFLHPFSELDTLGHDAPEPLPPGRGCPGSHAMNAKNKDPAMPRLPSPCSASRCCWPAAPAATAYVSNGGQRHQRDRHGHTTVTASLPVGKRPRGLALSSDNRLLYICASDSDTVQVMDLATRQIIRSCPPAPTRSSSPCTPTTAGCTSPTRTMRWSRWSTPRAARCWRRSTSAWSPRAWR